MRRFGFVSNSSTSSFIITKSKGIVPIVTLTIKADLSSFVRKEITTIEELDRIWDDCESYHNASYHRCRKAIEEGKIVCLGGCCDEDSGVEEILCLNGINGAEITPGCEVIEGEGGY